MMQFQIAEFFPTTGVKNVLDYGAGNSPYRQFITCNRYTTADIKQNLNSDIEHIFSPNCPLQLEDNTFDLVLLLDVLEHVPDPVFVLKEIIRLMVPEGKLIISLPFIYREHETPGDYWRYTFYGIQKLVEDQNGYIQRHKKVGNFAYTIISLFLERGIENGEKDNLGYLGRSINWLVRAALPLFSNVLKRSSGEHDGIYHHLLVEVKFN